MGVELGNEKKAKAAFKYDAYTPHRHSQIAEGTSSSGTSTTTKGTRGTTTRAVARATRQSATSRAIGPL